VVNLRPYASIPDGAANAPLRSAALDVVSHLANQTSEACALLVEHMSGLKKTLIELKNTSDQVIALIERLNSLDKTTNEDAITAEELSTLVISALQISNVGEQQKDT
jgi:hypothetical protein